MRSFLELIEQKETVIFTFGRFNPPTTGHEKLIQKAASVAGTMITTECVMTNIKEDNPLPVQPQMPMM